MQTTMQQTRIRQAGHQGHRARTITRAVPKPVVAPSGRDELMKAPMLAGAAVAACLLFGAQQPALAAAPASPVEAAYEQEAVVAEQKSMVEFMLQQQENAKKAAILAQRQQLQTELGRVEAALQAKLNQQKANVIGATKAGDERTAQSASAAATELEEKQAQIMKAAAQINSQLDRMELLERAKTAAAKQNLERAATDIDSTINATRLNPWLEAIGRARAQ